MCTVGLYKKTTSDVKVRGWRTWKASGVKDNYNGGYHVWTEKNALVHSPIQSSRSAMKTATKKAVHPPSHQNYVGFYAFKTRAAAIRYKAGWVLSEVELSGIVCHHSKGYRGQKVKLLSLSEPSLAKKYKVLCCSDRDSKRLKETFSIRNK